MSYGKRRTKEDSTELYRVVKKGSYRTASGDESVQTREWTQVYGPYGDLATAKGVRTRDAKYSYGSNITMTIQKATTVWEDVE